MARVLAALQTLPNLMPESFRKSADFLQVRLLHLLPVATSM